MAKGKYQEWRTPDKLTLLQAWARNGLTDEQIASNIGISRDTLYTWKKKYPDISDTLKRGKEIVDIEVENALLKRALGYEYEEVTTGLVWDKKANDYKERVTKTVKKQVAPDVTAAIFWLKNRKPDGIDGWRDKKDVSVAANISNPFDGITTEEIKKLIDDA
ncbi:transposase [Veillonella magna]|uniref:transposase n=1 Tax=Veillonella magna TaxID=464322 RepID=UPI000425FA0E|nr:transposase [Veillonella magna]